MSLVDNAIGKSGSLRDDIEYYNFIIDDLKEVQQFLASGLCF